MSKFQHVHIVYEAEVDLPAERFFDALTDWTGLAAYLPAWHPFKFSHVTLGEGSTEGRLPLTRLMHLDKSALPKDTPPDSLPDCFAETLIVADKEAGTIVYKVEETLGMRNYYGFQEVDSVSNGKCRTKLNVRFDCPSDVDLVPFRDTLIQVYKGVVHGIEEALAPSQRA